MRTIEAAKVVKVSTIAMRHVLAELGWHWAHQVYRSPITVMVKCIQYHRDIGDA